MLKVSSTWQVKHENLTSEQIYDFILDCHCEKFNELQLEIIRCQYSNSEIVNIIEQFKVNKNVQEMINHLT